MTHHQIIRELVVGIYACNQMPSITLDANFDQSTACNIPAAYIDTHVGQLLINLDYMIKVCHANVSMSIIDTGYYSSTIKFIIITLTENL